MTQVDTFPTGTSDAVVNENILSDEYLRRRAEFALSPEHAELAMVALALHQAAKLACQGRFLWDPIVKADAQIILSANHTLKDALDNFRAFALAHRPDHFLVFDRDLKGKVEGAAIQSSPIKEKLARFCVEMWPPPSCDPNTRSGLETISDLNDLRTLLPQLQGILEFIIFDCTSARHRLIAEDSSTNFPTQESPGAGAVNQIH